MKNQYDGELSFGWNLFDGYKQHCTRSFLRSIPDSLVGKKLLDLGCGPGDEFIEYQSRGASRIVGLDISPDMISVAKTKAVADNLYVSDMETLNGLPAKESFDLVVSKWAIQNVYSYHSFLLRLVQHLNPAAEIVFLWVHPIRQFVEKKRVGKNYFKQEVVHSVLFDGKVTVAEPSHTFVDFFNPFFLQNFDLISLEEGLSDGCEEINGDTYPSYLMVRARLRG